MDGNLNKYRLSTSREELFQTIRRRASVGESAWKENFDHALDDLEMISGNQWAEDILQSRADRPCITNNVLPTFVRQVTGDIKQNKLAIKVSSVEPGLSKLKSGANDLKIANLNNTQEYELAEVIEGIIKSIEYNCDATSVYQEAATTAAQSGFGFVRLKYDYIDNKSFDKDISVVYIKNQFSVIIDPHAVEFDKSDANYCFINDKMLKTEFEKRYPDASSEAVGEEFDDWYYEDHVRVSEYFFREECKKKIIYAFRWAGC